MDASLRKGLFSILLLHICVCQVLVTSETPLAPESILPLTEVMAQEAEVKELTLSAPGVEHDEEQNVVQDAGVAVEQAVVEEVAEEVAAPEAAADALEPAEQEAETAGEVSQEVAPEVPEEAASIAAVEEPAPEEKVVEEVAQPVGEEAEVAEAAGEQVAAAEPAQEEAVPEPAVVEAAEEVVEEVREEAAVEEAVEDGTEPGVETAEEVVVDSNETGASQASETGEPDLTPGPADTYVPPESQGPAIPAIPGSREETNHVGGENVQESNDFNEIITSKDELLNPVPAEEVPTLDNVVVVEDEKAEEEKEEEQVEEDEEEIPATASAPLTGEEMDEEGESVEATADGTVTGESVEATADGTVTGESVEATADEGAALGLEAWKIGAISAAVFLFLETIVIIVYILKCKKKTVSGAVPVKASEDCEAAETTAEASESSPAAEEDPTQQNNIAESLDMSQFQQEETMADIPLDPPAESSPEEPTDDVRTSVL